MWNTETRYDECNQTRERELSNEDWNNEATFHEFNGINQATLHARLIPFNLYMVPNWEKHENKEYLLTLRKIRNEMDEKLLSEGSILEKAALLPFSDNWEYEVDYVTSPRLLEQKAESKASFEDMRKIISTTKWTSDHLHLGNGNDIEASYGKLHKLPAEVRIPWHYPAIKPSETLNSADEVETLNAQIQSNVNFLANEPDRIQPNVYKRLWEYRNLGKVTPREFDPNRQERLDFEDAMRKKAYLFEYNERSK